MKNIKLPLATAEIENTKNRNASKTRNIKLPSATAEIESPPYKKVIRQSATARLKNTYMD